jgi:hypothetical protein
MYRCANPGCDFRYESMRAICPDPSCLERSVAGCGRYFRIEPDGSVAALGGGVRPADGDPNIAWLCCYCSMEYEVSGPGRVRPAPDAYGFIWRWQLENAEASVAHELG